LAGKFTKKEKRGRGVRTFGVERLSFRENYYTGKGRGRVELGPLKERISVECRDFEKLW
jgi:hypothetical protein